jgi:hypothetical protein
MVPVPATREPDELVVKPIAYATAVALAAGGVGAGPVTEPTDPEVDPEPPPEPEELIVYEVLCAAAVSAEVETSMV